MDAATPLAESGADATDETSDQERRLAGALEWARSDSPEDLEKLRALLSSKDGVESLDSAADRARLPPRRMRLARVYDALGSNRGEGARRALFALASSVPALNSDACNELLIRALGTTAQPSPEVVRYLAAQSALDSVERAFALDALIDIGSPATFDVFFERVGASPAPHEESVSAIHRALSRHRNAAPLLANVSRRLTTSMPVALRVATVEALFDPDPGRWANVDSPPLAADSSALSPEARALRRALAKQALAQVAVGKELREAVLAASRD